MPALLLKIALSLLCFASLAEATTFELGISGGTLQQPTSQYYHAAYGGFLGVGTDDGLFMSRVSYVERPQFSNSGFSDQDYGFFLLFGSTLTKAKLPYGIRGWFGPGQMQGYIKANDKTSGLPNRRYAISGLALQAEAFYRMKYVEGAISLQNFTGVVDQFEFDNRVAWPFNFFMLSVACNI